MTEAEVFKAYKDLTIEKKAIRYKFLRRLVKRRKSVEELFKNMNPIIPEGQR